MDQKKKKDRIKRVAAELKICSSTKVWALGMNE